MDKPNWQNREYTSLFGIVEAISCLTVQVLDIVVLPKHCETYKIQKSSKYSIRNIRNLASNYEESSNAIWKLKGLNIFGSAPKQTRTEIPQIKSGAVDGKDCIK